MALFDGIRGFLRPVFSLAALLLLLGLFCRSPLSAQDASERKTKFKLLPQYPEIARKMGLSGSVKLEIVIAPNGTVKDTKVIGGHPILVSAVVDAVKKWKFEPAQAESIKTIEFKF